MTPHGFIMDSDKALKTYKEERAAEWKAILGGGDFNVVEETPSIEDITSFTQEPE